MFWRVSASSAPNGSSISSTAGSTASARDADTLAHAARQAVGMVSGETGEADEFNVFFQRGRHACAIGAGD
jgi:hypothetical protein